jgi:DNA-binding XRE family transcriptional regulator
MQLQNLSRRAGFVRLARSVMLATLKAKVAQHLSNRMGKPEKDHRPPNYIRVHRRRAGLSQHELGSVIGYRDAEGVARHEKSLIAPSLELAISYELIFRVPVSEIFAGLRDQVAAEVELRLERLEQQLGERSAQDRNALVTARKLVWLTARRSDDYEPLS